MPGNLYFSKKNKVKEKTLTIHFTEFDTPDDLSLAEQELIESATKATDTSYAPYSQFKVGAAVLLENGEIIMGSNQENTAYPSGLCAERVAVFTAKANFPELKIKAVAVTAKTKNFSVDTPITPCGACRQVIAETEKRQHSKIKILMKGQKGPVLSVEGIENLLPLMFHEEKLKK